MADTPASPAPVPNPSPTPPAPAKGGNRTVIIILCVLGGLLLLFGGCVVGCTYLVRKKAKEYSEITQRNPAYVTVTMLAAVHPDVELLSKDSTSGIVKLRNKKTGQETTIDTTKFNQDTITEALEKFAAGKGVPVKLSGSAATEPAPESEPATAATTTAPAAADVAKLLPAYAPPYPGAATVDANSATALGMRSVEYVMTTSDKPAAVIAFYEKKFKAAGVSVVSKSNEGAAITLIGAAKNPAGTVTIEAAPESDNESRVAISLALLGK